MRALVLCQVNQLGSLAGSKNRRVLDRLVAQAIDAPPLERDLRFRVLGRAKDSLLHQSVQLEIGEDLQHHAALGDQHRIGARLRHGF